MLMPRFFRLMLPYLRHTTRRQRHVDAIMPCCYAAAAVITPLLLPVTIYASV